MKSPHPGTVYLVGAGPGALGLITVRGIQCLRRAEVVVYDNLCNPFLLREAPRTAEIIYAGKHSGCHTLTQQKIERVMVRRALAGRTVVRLKGGDPFVFGRGAEEAASLRKHGIPFEVVPGISSAIAVPGYAGIPATHRSHASGVAIVTGSEDPTKADSSLNYEALAKFPGTVIILMGVKRLADVANELVRCGKPPATPAAMVRWGTRGFQRTLTGTLGTIAARARKTNLRPPAVMVVGDVVHCRSQVCWFEKRPLFGQRIVVTRSRDQASELAAQLNELGAEVLELPTIEIERIDNDRVCRAARAAGDWDWIVFTSPWAVRFYLDRVIAEHGDLRALRKARFGVIGPATALALKDRGLPVDLQPRVHTGEGLAREIKRHGDFRGARVLLPRSAIGRDEVEKALRHLGAKVHSLPIYRNRLPSLTWELEALERIGADLVTFTSSSTAGNFIRLMGRNWLRKHRRHLRFVSIGPVTSRTMRKVGLRVDAEAKRSTIPGLVKAVIQCVRRRK
jgi:uroporphyrinogen III methyltransferase/synthase